MPLRKPSPATVISLIALFVALSGVAWAASALNKNEVKSKHIKDGQVKGKDVADDGLTGADIVESSLEGVIGPAGAQGPPGQQGPPGPSTGSAGGDLAGNYPNPSVANNAINAAKVANDALGGADVDESSLALGSEPWHVINASGEPNFYGDANCIWNNFDGNHNPAAFLRDRSGFVHLRGVVDGDGNCDIPSSSARIFTLPVGYRPAVREVHVTLTNGALGRVNVEGSGLLGFPAGAVSVDPPTTEANALQWLSLDGISFRCAPAGVDGCPQSAP